MKKAVWIAFACVLAAVVVFVSGVQSSPALLANKEIKSKPSLICDENGNFTILVVSDPQCETVVEWEEAEEELEHLVERAEPDFVLINGDVDADNEIPANMWDNFISPLTKRGIFWATTNGNHDPYKEKYFEMFTSYEQCLNTKVSVDDPNYEEDRPMNYVLPVYANDGTTPVFAIYGMDTGISNQKGYEGLTAKQISWYENQSNTLKKQNNGVALTSLLCMHIPFPQIIDMYYSIEGGGTAEEKISGGLYPVYGILNGSRGGVKKYTCENGTKVSKTWIHTTAPDNDRGMFDKILEQGDVKAIFFGHDHQNNFAGSYKGVVLGFAGKLSTGSYSDELCRGGRVVQFNQSNPEEFTVSWIGALPTSKDQPAIYSDGSLAE